MKTAFILISSVLLLVVAVLFMREQGTREELRQAQTANTTLSNQVAEARIQITEQTVNGIKLETNLTRRVDELLKATARLATVSEKLGKTEALLQSAQAQVQDCQKQFAAAESQVANLQILLHEKQAKLEQQDSELARALDTLQKQEKEFALVSSSLQRAESESEAFRRDFNDAYALRQQLDRLKRYVKPAEPTPMGGINFGKETLRGGNQLAVRPRDPKGKVFLQPDGSVRLAQ